MLSRWDLPLTRFVPELLGHITVLRGDVVRMDRDEAAALIAHHARTTSAEVFEAINAQTQGWCAAIVLTARAVGAAPDPVAAARHFARGDAKIADQVASEVFATLQPAERHLLLCTAGEEVVAVSTAALLTNNPRAGEVLAGLEVTGLLVSRVGSQEHPDGLEPAQSPADVRYRIHPLLAEVVRRRHVAGGVDVAQARATVARAVRLDLSRGDTTRAFDRLVAVHEPDLAAEVLATEGVRLVMGGQGPRIAAFVRQYGDVIDTHPAAWFAVALERWQVNDVETALRWMHRLLAQAKTSLAQAPPVGGQDGYAPGRAVVACIRLMRARLGLEPLAAAVRDARQDAAQLQEDPHLRGAEDAVLPILLDGARHRPELARRARRCRGEPHRGRDPRPLPRPPRRRRGGRVPPRVHRVHGGSRTGLRAGRHRRPRHAGGRHLALTVHRRPRPPGAVARPARRPARLRGAGRTAPQEPWQCMRPTCRRRSGCACATHDSTS